VETETATERGVKVRQTERRRRSGIIGLDRQTEKEKSKGDRNMPTGDKVTDREIES
jgi:hypothetical protein